jgi:hypothetical protein
MKTWFGIAVAVVGTVVVAGLVTVALLPKDFVVTRTAQIDAPADVVWEHVSVLENHTAWSPWQAKDPSTVNTYSGPEGVGRTMSWVGEVTGEGSQSITALSPKSRVDTHLDFGEMGTAEAWLALDVVDANTTAVTWGLSGTNEGFFGGAISAMMDSFIGADYEDGLGRLKVVSEATPPPAPEPPPVIEPPPVEGTEAAPANGEEG